MSGNPPAEGWWPWFRDLLDAYEAAIEGAAVDWATDGEGNPFVWLGQRRPGGIGYPHAMVLSFSVSYDQANSKRQHELYRITTDVSVFRLGDPHTPEQNMRQSIQDIATVLDALYGDRTLGRECAYLRIQQMDAFALENADGETETVGTAQLQLTKRADQPQ